MITNGLETDYRLNYCRSNTKTKLLVRNQFLFFWFTAFFQFKLRKLLDFKSISVLKIICPFFGVLCPSNFLFQDPNSKMDHWNFLEVRYLIWISYLYFTLSAIGPWLRSRRLINKSPQAQSCCLALACQLASSLKVEYFMLTI